jgi:hypothetical protein
LLNFARDNELQVRHGRDKPRDPPAAPKPWPLRQRPLCEGRKKPPWKGSIIQINLPFQGVLHTYYISRSVVPGLK